MHVLCYFSFFRTPHHSFLALPKRNLHIRFGLTQIAKIRIHNRFTSPTRFTNNQILNRLSKFDKDTCGELHKLDCVRSSFDRRKLESRSLLLRKALSNASILDTFKGSAGHQHILACVNSRCASHPISDIICNSICSSSCRRWRSQCCFIYDCGRLGQPPSRWRHSIPHGWNSRRYGRV